jgi:hypothetical protein
LFLFLKFLYFFFFFFFFFLILTKKNKIEVITELGVVPRAPEAAARNQKVLGPALAKLLDVRESRPALSAGWWPAYTRCPFVESASRAGDRRRAARRRRG